MPGMLTIARDLFEAAPRGHAVRRFVDDAVRTALCKRIAFLDQEPSLLTRFAAVLAAVCSHQRPAALELIAVEPELEMSLFVACDRISAGNPRPAIPHHHRAGPVLVGRDDALEAAVFERMVFDVDREPLVLRIETRALGYRPAQQHAAELEPEVVMQAARSVLLDHERQRLRLGVHDPPARLGGQAEVALFTVALQAQWTPTLAASLANSAAALPPKAGAQFAPWGGPAALIGSRSAIFKLACVSPGPWRIPATRRRESAACRSKPSSDGPPEF